MSKSKPVRPATRCKEDVYDRASPQQHVSQLFCRALADSCLGLDCGPPLEGAIGCTSQKSQIWVGCLSECAAGFADSRICEAHRTLAAAQPRPGRGKAPSPHIWSHFQNKSSWQDRWPQN